MSGMLDTFKSPAAGCAIATLGLNRAKISTLISVCNGCCHMYEAKKANKQKDRNFHGFHAWSEFD